MPSPIEKPLETIHEDEAGNDDFLGPVMPKAKRRKVLEHEAAYLEGLPSAQMYEKSYMHRDNITHVEVAQAADFFITGSADGHIKFWKKQAKGVEFAKHFRAHLGSIQGLAVSHDSTYLASISTDASVKIFDIRTLDMMAMLRLPFVPSCVEWIFKAGSSRSILAVAEKLTSKVHVYDFRSPTSEPLESFTVGHPEPIVAMRYCSAHDTVVSVDQKGTIEYWRGSDHQFPSSVANFKLKMETDLYALAKAKTTADSIAISAQGNQFALFCRDKKVRVFWLAKGKLRRVYDESSEAATELQRADTGALKLEAIDFGKRMATERSLSSDDSTPQPNAVFDSSGNFLIYPTIFGIKVVNLVSNKLSRVIGKVENTERFLRLGLYQGGYKAGAAAKISGSDSKTTFGDPTIIALAYQKPRFFIFTRREPDDTDDLAQGRDVFNEKPAMELIQNEDGEEESPDALPRGAVMHTTRGDITIRLHPVECPKTIENFATHAKNGYYNNTIFHRVIKGFMIQTGDPLGDGTGGTSIWGSEFADEFHRDLRHDRAFTVSMANGGPNTNGSQFFITTVPTPWLNNKHTVFGRVIKGADVVQNIEKSKTNPKDDKPYEDIKIINIEIKQTAD